MSEQQATRGTAMATDDALELEIDRDMAARYIFWMHRWFLLLVWGMSFAQRSAHALRYRIEGDVLRIDGGILFPVQRSVPLWKITDVTIGHDLVSRLLSIHLVTIETEGRSAPYPWYAASLIALRDPEQVRDQLLQHMKAARAQRRPPD